MTHALHNFIHRALLTVLSILLVTSCFATWIFYYYDSPGPLSQQQTVVFPRGEGFRAIVTELHDKGIIRHVWLFESFAVLTGDGRKFKAGEYNFSGAISPRLVMDMIAEGKVVVHKLTIPEGLTVQQILQQIRAEPALEGSITKQIAEGTLLPQTYQFTFGDARQELLDRMLSGMTQTLAQLWEKRKTGLPFETPQQALVLASIVEKETGVDGERGRVASVFINRLRKGMKLQSDPTIIYGIDKGGHLDHPVNSTELRTPTPYNTYVIAGLPPTPIANPGRAAIEAVLNPPDTQDLYFVATGTGGHNFSSTLAGHNDNVQKYREVMASKSK